MAPLPTTENRTMRILIVLFAASSLSGCAAALVTGAVVGTTAKVATTAVGGVTKVAVGTTKLAYHGTKAVVTAGRDEPRTVDCADLPDPKPQTCLDFTD